jgi:hypothetical protein
MCLPLSPARAGDRKDSVARDAQSDSRFSDFVTNSDSKVSRSRRDATTKEKESEPTPGKERKKIILFQFDRKFGDVSLQPVVGQVNGAQLSVGF